MSNAAFFDSNKSHMTWKECEEKFENAGIKNSLLRRSVDREMQGVKESIAVAIGAIAFSVFFIVLFTMTQKTNPIRQMWSKVFLGTACVGMPTAAAIFLIYNAKNHYDKYKKMNNLDQKTVADWVQKHNEILERTKEHYNQKIQNLDASITKNEQILDTLK